MTNLHTDHSRLISAAAGAGFVLDPVKTVSDLGCSLERLSILLDTTNNNLATDVSERPDLPAKDLCEAAFDVWCIYLVVSEKLNEARETVNLIETALLAPASRDPATDARPDRRGETLVRGSSLPQDAESDAQHVRSTWNAAMGRHLWDAALATYEEASRAVTAVANAAPDNDTAVDAMTDAATKALDDLLELRSPDAEAMLRKLRIIDKEGYHNNAAAWASIVDDTRALTGNAGE